MKQKYALVLGGGGFIGGHLAKRLKEEGYWVRIADIKPKHEYWNLEEICDDYISCDLTDPNWVSAAMRLEVFDVNGNIVCVKGQYHKQPYTDVIPFDEVYQLAADMGGAGYIFTGENDANVMHNSALINLNVAAEAVKTKVKKYSILHLLVCTRNIINLIRITQTVKKIQLTQQILIQNMVGKNLF